MDSKTQKIVSNVGVPALLEQTAEECLELGAACLKLSRKIRNENPTPVPLDDILANLNEEVADIVNCINILAEIDLANDDLVDLEMRDKITRWVNRIDRYNTSEDDPEFKRVVGLMTKIYMKVKGE